MSIARIAGATCLLVAVLTADARAHDEIVVGRDGAGQLKAHIDFLQPVSLPVSIFGGISGFAAAEPGLSSLFVDEPDEDFFAPSGASSIRFVLLARDPGVEVWNDTGSGFMPIGGSFFLGPPFFDAHAIWNIPSGAPGAEYSLTIRFHDVNGVHADSDPVELTFVSFPEPSGALILSGLCALSLRRPVRG
ncbi:MAG: hypothetical protein ACREJC_13720 [Tepidisphaeraceae bacterium]